MIVERYSTRFACLAALFLASAFSGQAQIYTINGANVQTRAFNDIPGATMTLFNTYPSLIFFGESKVSAPTGFANRDVWSFSSDGGATAYQLKNNDYFHFSVNLTLTGSPISPRKEAGLLFATANHGDIQLIVNTDGHEVVQFGGISFYDFRAQKGLAYNSGDNITLGIDYFLGEDGKNALQFSANEFQSPVFEFAVGEGIGDGSKLGGYFQIVNDPNNPNNAGAAIFDNITIPEPSAATLVGLGFAFLLILRRRV
jgi:hypothetical protein